MENELTFEDFFAVVGIIGVAALLYFLYNKNKSSEKRKTSCVGGFKVDVEEIYMNPNLYAPSNTLDGYMTVYDYSEEHTIGAIPMVVDNNQ